MLKTSKAFDQAATMEAYVNCALRNIISRFESISPYHKVGFFYWEKYGATCRPSAFFHSRFGGNSNDCMMLSPQDVAQRLKQILFADTVLLVSRKINKRS